LTCFSTLDHIRNIVVVNLLYFLKLGTVSLSDNRETNSFSWPFKDNAVKAHYPASTFSLNLSNKLRYIVRYRKMSAIFDFSSVLLLLLLMICTCTYIRELRPTVFDGKKVRKDGYILRVCRKPVSRYDCWGWTCFLSLKFSKSPFVLLPIYLTCSREIQRNLSIMIVMVRSCDLSKNYCWGMQFST
jgi:hypothetical protein